MFCKTPAKVCQGVWFQVWVLGQVLGFKVWSLVTIFFGFQFAACIGSRVHGLACGVEGTGPPLNSALSLTFLFEAPRGNNMKF